ncbi:MAG: NAD(P)H-hydrate dehydratase [Bacteroidales bacterium]|nr:NAD(P)H-hydrate dehydratase [Bacteroidales bacterium]
MKIFTTQQIADIDKFTIENEPIKSIKLMERAATNLAMYIFKYSIKSGFVVNYDNHEYQSNSKILIICGPGNNGGDGLAMARILVDKYSFYQINVVLFAEKEKLSNDCKKNWKRLKKLSNEIKIFHTTDPDEVYIDRSYIVIDALFGNGLNRPLKDPYKTLIQKINKSGAYVISIDLPSGLMGEDNRNNDKEAIVKSHNTLTLQFPKLSFFDPANEDFIKKFEIIDIQLHRDAINNTHTRYYYIDEKMINDFFKIRRKFSEKRDYGHALLIAGMYAKTGAAILAAKACLRSGVGLLHTHVPKNSVLPIQVALPETMLSIDEHEEYFTNVNIEPYYTAVGIGPGIGTNELTQQGFYNLIEQVKNKNLPLVIDADGLNILCKHKDWLKKLPQNTILTPHKREFERLFGTFENFFDRIHAASDISQNTHCIIVLKGAYTQIYTPDGNIYFNSTGTPAMAKAGMGDVLTGIILALIAQGYKPEQAAIMAVYSHGKAGEKCTDFYDEYSVLPSDLIEKLSFNCTYEIN